MGEEQASTRLAHRRVDLRGARYVGGHPQRPNVETTRFLYLTSRGVEFRTGITPVTIPWDTVTALVVAAPGELDGWNLLTDDLATPDDLVSYLRVDAKAGSPAFELRGVSPDQLRSRLEPVAYLVALPDVLGGSSTPTTDDGDADADTDLDTRQMEALGLDGLIESVEEDGAAEVAGVADELAETDADVDVAEDTIDVAEDIGDAVEDTEGVRSDDASAIDDVAGEADEDPTAAEEAGDTERVGDATDDLEATEALEPFDETPDDDEDATDDGTEAVDVADEDIDAFTEPEPDGRAEVGEPAEVDEVVESDVVVVLRDEDLELDPLQLTALGIDPPHETTNGHAAPLIDEVDVAPAAAAEPGCPNGHANPDGTRFCLTCGAPMQAPSCPEGHTNPAGAAFCGECGASLRPAAATVLSEATELELREEAVRVALETLRRMRGAQEAEVRPLLREVGSLTALASDQRVLPLRKSLHEQHITTKRAALALAEARRTAGVVSAEESDAEIALIRCELDFAIQMLLEVTELIALPGNDDEGRELVRRHMSEIFSECDEKRRAAQLRLAQVRGESHAVRAAELESEVAAKAVEIRSRRNARKPDLVAVWRLEEEQLGLRVTQLTERRAAAIAQADVPGTDEADALLASARDDAKRHAERAPAQVEKLSRFEAEIMTGMPTVLTGANRVPRTADRRVGAAKRAVAEFRDFFDSHPAPAIGVDEMLLGHLAAEWEEYNVVSRRFVGAPTVVPGRSSQRTKVQWIKYDQMIVNSWHKRVGVVAAELEVSEAAGDSDRSDGLRRLLDAVTEALRVASQAAKVEVPAL